MRLVAYTLLLMLAGCADHLILYPHVGPEDSMGATRRCIPFHGGQLEIYVARSPGCEDTGPQAYAIEFVGNASRAEWVAMPTAQRWRGHPIEIWTMNYPGYGDSTGPAKLASLPPAALAAYDALAAEAHGKPIFAFGESLGTTLALYVAANRPVAGLVLHNPPPLRQLLLGHFGWWNLWIGASVIAAQVPDEMDSLANARRTRAPAVFLLSGHDQLVPPKYQRMVVDSYAGENRPIVLPHAGHNSGIPEEVESQVDDAQQWLWEKRDGHREH